MYVFSCNIYYNYAILAPHFNKISRLIVYKLIKVFFTMLYVT